LLLDFILWLLVLTGWESVSIPADFASTHQAHFVFLYSHGLVAALAWSILAAAVAFGGFARRAAIRGRAAALIGMAVFSRWLLDALVHRPELPLMGADSPLLGLGLWRQQPIALAVEAALVVGGLLLFVQGGNLARGRQIALSALTLLILVFIAVGMTVAPPPPSAFAMAGRSMLTLALICAIAGWFGRLAPPRPP